MMSEDSTTGLLSEILSMDTCKKGVGIPGLTGATSTKTSGVKTDETVGATIRLDHLSPNEIQNIMSILKPYDKNLTVEMEKDPDATGDLGNLGLDLKDRSEMLPNSYNLKKNVSLDASAMAPDMSLDGPSGRINMPERFGSGLSGPSLNGDLPSFTLNKPSVDSGGTFSIPTTGLNGTNVKGDLGGTFKAPDYNLKQDLSLDASAKAPGISLDGPSGTLNASQGFGGNISVPNVNGDFPSLRVNKPSVDSGAKVSIPKEGLTELSTPSDSLGIKKLEIKKGGKKYMPPKFTMPNFNLPQTQVPTGKLDDIDVSGAIDTQFKALELDTKNPDVALNGPKLDFSVPDADVQAPNLDIKSPSKINWPHSKINKPKLHIPMADAALHTPNVDATLPKAEIESPDFDVEASAGKMNWPHLKWKKVKAPKADINADMKPLDTNLSAPSFEGKINAPKAEVDLPKADLKSPDFHAPDLDAGATFGKINWPHLKAKTPKVEGLNTDIDADLKSADLNAGLTLPSAHLDKPSLDYNAPNLDVDTPSGNIKLPSLKKPRFSGLNLKSPNLDADVSTPDLAPKIDGDINAPHLETSTGKFKLPHLKKPKAPGFKVKSPDLNTDLSAPDLSLKAPNIDGELNLPKADLETSKIDIDTPDLETSPGKWKWPTFKKQKAPGLKVKSPDFDTDLSAPDLSLKAPNIDGDLELPKANLEDSKLNIDTPDLENSQGKWKWPTFKKPKGSGLKLKSPNLDADVSAPDLSLSTPQIGEIKGPEVDPLKLELEGPKLDAPDIKAPSGKIKFPTLKKPKLSTLKGLKHDINADAKIPDVNLKGPNINMDTPDTSLSLPKIDTPDFSVTTPDIQGPDIGLNSGDLKLDPKLKLPNAEATAPNLDLKASGPSLKAPQIQGTADLDMNLPKADLKAPKWPKFGFSKPTVKGPNLDVDSDLNAPNLSFPDGNVKLSGAECNLSSPQLNGNLSTPTAGVDASSLEAPEVLVKPPAVNTAVEKHKFPHFKFPKFGFSNSEGNVEVNGVDGEVTPFNTDAAMPMFNVHKLPKSSNDDTAEISDMFEQRKNEIEAKDYLMRKGVCLPVLNVKNKTGEKVDIMERLKKAKEKVPIFNVSPTEARTSLDAGADTGIENSSLSIGNTFKVEKPEWNLERPNISTDENDKFKYGLSNMLGLNTE
ncbi:neuroblast differentiation-associated protein AHNAK isoform X2 [Thalassophryne amazonica]|uniref:neuroblast differentiation-associated protein AHNAK isoform X2 n=1 Tax=Thalassophryne amazonica TaxID=390379 RepID=UPI0014723C4B|nr:neuroblast differentiation-associated protein AHNAK isoform X2 [Thalassophryne amazonica]